MYVINSWLACREYDNMAGATKILSNWCNGLRAKLWWSYPRLCNLLHCLALVIASLGGLITEGWHTWIMEMEIIMRNSSMEMEIPKGTMGYTMSYLC